MAEGLTIVEATADRWDDLEDLMGPKGGAGGCWCMLWRLKRPDFKAGEGEGNRAAIRRVAETADAPPGLLAYEGALCVGWLSIAPRREFPRLDSSRILYPLDDREVWSITCFLIRKGHRRKGIATALLVAAKEFVRSRGGGILEGYPIDPEKPEYPPVYAWTGLKKAFDRAGFSEAARRSPTRPIMRASV